MKFKEQGVGFWILNTKQGPNQTKFYPRLLNNAQSSNKKFGHFWNYYLFSKNPEAMLQANLNDPKFPICSKNHKTIFNKYYGKLGVQENWLDIFTIFLQFSTDFSSFTEKEKEKA